MAKPTYAAIPARALGDKRLSAEMYRALGAIAAHDRLGANGVGCYASRARLAELAGCHENSLSRSITDLITFGYVEARPHHLNHKLRIYRVLYTDFDGEYLKAMQPAKGSKSDTYKPGIGSNFATIGEVIGSKPVNENGPIGNTENAQPVDIVKGNLVNIFSETVIHPVETGIHRAEALEPVALEGIDSAEARSERGGGKVGAMLGMVERSLSAGKTQNLRQHYQYLEGLVGDNPTLSIADPNYHWAERLFHQVEEALNAA